MTHNILELDLAQHFVCEDSTEEYEYNNPGDEQINVTSELQNIIDEIKVHLSQNHLSLFQKSILDPDVKPKIDRIIKNYVEDNGLSVSDRSKQKMVKDIQNELTGLGPLQPVLEDNEVNDILVNYKDEVYIEKRGVLVPTNIRFINEDQVLNIARKILTPLGKTISPTNPIEDARIGTSRVNVTLGHVHGGIALKGTNISIRKFPDKAFGREDFIKNGLLNDEMFDFLSDCVAGRINCMIAGGTGSGKTTTLKAMAGFISDKERVITLEDSAEMNLDRLYPNKHFVPEECRHTESEETSVTMSDLVKNALRQRPDRIIIGEVRGIEALDMLNAMDTGHEGSISTGHANSASDMLSRLIRMIKMGGADYGEASIKDIIASSLDIVIYQSRDKIDGTRIIKEIVELEGLDGNGDFIITPIFKHQKQKENNRVVSKFYQLNGISDRLATKLLENHIDPEKWQFNESERGGGNS